MKKIIITVFAIFASICSFAQADLTLSEVLRSVEANNETLGAMRYQTASQVLEAKSGNSLEDPEVEFVHLWGKPSEAGKTGELVVTQSFDFPTAYAHRSRLAREKARQYGHEYDALRQEIMLQAKMAYMELHRNLRLKLILEQRYEDAVKVSEFYERRIQAGDVNILEKNNIDHEKVTALKNCRLNDMEISSLRKTLTALNGGTPFEIAHYVGRPCEFKTANETVPPYEVMLERYRKELPVIQAMLSGQAASHQDVKVSRSASLPKLTLGYKHEFASAAGEREKFNGVVVGMSVPMFGNRFNVKRAKIEALSVNKQVLDSNISMETSLKELYERLGLLTETMRAYEELGEPCNSMDEVSRVLTSGEVPAHQYFSELGSYYDIWEERIRLMFDIRLTVAQINMIDL